MKLSRRELLRDVAGGVAALVSGSLGCKSAREPSSCLDTSGLAESDVQARVVLAYVDRSNEPGKSCAACAQFVAASSDGQCGSCKVVKGPIHPKGFCKVYAPKA